MSGAVDPLEETGAKRSASPASVESITSSDFYLEQQRKMRERSGVAGPAPGSLEAANAAGGAAAPTVGPVSRPAAAAPAELRPADGAAISVSPALATGHAPVAISFGDPAAAAPAVAATRAPAPETVVAQQIVQSPADSVSAPAVDTHAATVHHQAVRSQSTGPASRTTAVPAQQPVRIAEVTTSHADNFELNVATGEGGMNRAHEVATVTRSEGGTNEDGDAESGQGRGQQQD